MWIVISLVVLCGIWCFFWFRCFTWEPQMNASWLKSFWFSEGDGWWSYGYHYTLREKEWNYSLVYEQIAPEQYTREKNLTVEEVKKLEDELYRWQFSEWNGFEKDNPDVLDGSSWSLNIRYHDGQEVRAHGYESYPDDFWNKTSHLTSFLNELL